MTTPSVDWFAISPSLALLAGSGVALLAAVLVPRWLRAPLAAMASAGGFAGAFVAAALLYWKTPEAQTLLSDSMVRDRFGSLAQMIVAGVGLLSVAIAYGRASRGVHAAEFYALLAAIGGGMAFLVQANNLMTLFLALEWFSVGLYILCAIELDVVGSLEAGLKYLIVGGFGSAVLLFGSALVFGATGELGFQQIAEATTAQNLVDDPLLVAGLAMIIAGLGFKSSAAPFHQWTPDVYEGAPTPVTAFMSAATKTVAVVLMMRVLVTAFPEESELWTIAVAAIVCISLAWGNLAALVQRNVKRMLAYSSIAHAGFLLIAVAANNELGGRALVFYLIPYAAASLGAFAVVAARERELGVPVTLDNLGGLGWERPLLGVAMWAFMLSFAGLPPTGGFVGKFYVFSSAYDRGWTWLVIVGVVATLISLYYYLAIIRALYMRSPLEMQLAPTGGSPPREFMLGTAVFVAMAVTIGSFIFVEPLIDLAQNAAESLTF
jgi:NADH-quinone oxidoreductase subunit N